MKKPEDITIINGIILTPGLVQAIDFLQTGGSLYVSDFSKRKFNNAGLLDQLEYISELENFLVDALVYSEVKPKRVIKMLKLIAYLRDTFSQLKLPSDLKINL